MNGFGDKVSFIWSVADLLRGPYKPAQYGRVILPLTVLRRLDCVLEPTKAAVLAKHASLKGGQLANIEPVLNHAAKQAFHNTSKLDFPKLTDDPANIAPNLEHYIASFSSRAREIIEYFGFEAEIEKLDKVNRLYLVVKKFAGIDLHPDVVSNVEMGYIFEELVRKFSEAANETAGDHFTPREIIRLMVNLLFEPDSEVLTRPGIVRTLFDPACGTGGMLSVAEEHLRRLNPGARLECYGQEYNEESYAICGSDLMMKGQNLENIKFGDSFTADGHAAAHFDYLLANPPFGVEWKPQERFIRDEAESLGFDGRFGAGLPRINDGSFLFLQHMISKMKPEGSRLAIVFNRSPLYAGDAGSGESTIREWLVSNDWIELIVALPTDLFYNTGIPTYVWLLTNAKSPQRRGTIQLIDASDLFESLRRGIGDKKRFMNDDHVAEIVRSYGEYRMSGRSVILSNDLMWYRQLYVDKPLRLAFSLSEDRIAQLKAGSAIERLRPRKSAKGKANATGSDPDLVSKVLEVIESKSTDTVWRSRGEFLALLGDMFNANGVSLTGPQVKAVANGLSQRDPEAGVCTSSSGESEADLTLRDSERIPLNEDPDDFCVREVLPLEPDSWWDVAKSKTGIEIPFARAFRKNSRTWSMVELEWAIRSLLESRDTEAMALVQAIENESFATRTTGHGDYVYDGCPVPADRLPAGWQMVANRALFSERKVRGGEECELLSVTLARGITRQADETGRKDTSSEDKSDYKLVEPGDLVYNTMRMWQGAVGVSKYAGIVSPAYVVLRPRVPMNPHYFAYLFKTPVYIDEFNRFSWGLCDDMNSLRFSQFKLISSVYPPCESQHEICGLLDSCLPAIDAALAVLSLVDAWRRAEYRRSAAAVFLGRLWPQCSQVVHQLSSLETDGHNSATASEVGALAGDGLLANVSMLQTLIRTFRESAVRSLLTGRVLVPGRARIVD